MPDPSPPFDRYLRLLGIDDVPSGLAGLQLVVRRHLCRVPFENVSKLLLLAREGTGRPRSLAEFLDGIEERDFGGTCHSNNPFLADLLRHLGYGVDLLGADMYLPNVHTCLRVRLDAEEYHVDVGYGGPFRHPLRLHGLPCEFQEGELRYVFDRNRHEDAYEMAVFAGVERRHGYVVHGPPRLAGFFEPTVRDSFAPGRTFVTNLRIVRVFEDHSAELWNRGLIVRRGSESRHTELRDMAELKRAVASDLAMPRCPIEDAVTVVERATAAPFFPA